MLKEDQNIFYELRHRLLEKEEALACELRLVKKGGQAFFTNFRPFRTLFRYSFRRVLGCVLRQIAEKVGYFTAV